MYVFHVIFYCLGGGVFGFGVFVEGVVDVVEYGLFLVSGLVLFVCHVV